MGQLVGWQSGNRTACHAGGVGQAIHSDRMPSAQGDVSKGSRSRDARNTT